MTVRARMKLAGADCAFGGANGCPANPQLRDSSGKLSSYRILRHPVALALVLLLTIALAPVVAKAEDDPAPEPASTVSVEAEDEFAPEAYPVALVEEETRSSMSMSMSIGASGEVVHKINIVMEPPSAGGAVTVSSVPDKPLGVPGQSRVVSASPDEGWEVESITESSTGPLGGNEDRNNGYFIMPDSDTTVTVRFKRVDGNNPEFVVPTESSTPHVSYRTHVQRIGWQGYVSDGAMSGTSGRSLRLEGINIRLPGMPCSGGIQYRTHVQRIGWQGWRRDNAMAGTKGKSYRLEAIEIKLYGEMSDRYDVYYRVHCQRFGWMGWARNGQRSGSAGYSRRLEGIQIVLVPKGQPGPGPTLNGITQRFSAPFRQKGKR